MNTVILMIQVMLIKNKQMNNNVRGNKTNNNKNYKYVVF